MRLQQVPDYVSILVFVEMPLRLELTEVIEIIQCSFNPCFCGNAAEAAAV